MTCDRGQPVTRLAIRDGSPLRRRPVGAGGGDTRQSDTGARDAVAPATLWRDLPFRSAAGLRFSKLTRFFASSGASHFERHWAALIAVTALVMLGGCHRGRFDGLPREGVFQEVVVDSYGPSEIRFTFDNFTKHEVTLPKVELDCGCLDHAFNSDKIDPGGSTVLAITFTVLRRSTTTHQVRLSWSSGLVTTLGFIVRGANLRGTELSTTEVAVDDWVRSGALRLGFYSEYLNEPRPFDSLARVGSDLRVRANGHSLNLVLVSISTPTPSALSGDILIPFQAEVSGAPFLEFEVAGLPSVQLPEAKCEWVPSWDCGDQQRRSCDDDDQCIGPWVTFRPCPTTGPKGAKDCN